MQINNSFKTYGFFLVMAFLLWLLQACTPEGGNTSNGDNAIDSGTILYNVRDNLENNASWKIALLQDSIESILVEDRDYDHWWARLHPSKDYFICYRSPKGDPQADNDYSRAQLWRYDIDGSNGKKLIGLDDYNWLAQGVADWSPNGEYLVMVAEVYDEPNNPDDHYFQLFRTNADGTNPIQLTFGAGLRGDPSWTNDGESIVYVAFPDDYDYGNIVQLLLDIISQSPLELHMADISDSGELSNINRLTNDNIRDNDPYISPDGTYIAWESFEDNLGTIRTYDFSTKEVKTILDIDEFHCCPTWNIDPNRFLIHSLKVGAPFYIAEYNTITKEYSKMLFSNTKGYINPQWIEL